MEPADTTGQPGHAGDGAQTPQKSGNTGFYLLPADADPRKHPLPRDLASFIRLAPALGGLDKQNRAFMVRVMAANRQRCKRETRKAAQNRFAASLSVHEDLLKAKKTADELVAGLRTTVETASASISDLYEEARWVWQAILKAFRANEPLNGKRITVQQAHAAACKIADLRARLAGNLDDSDDRVGETAIWKDYLAARRKTLAEGPRN